jgi:AraC-like DNA-binding protein
MAFAAERGPAEVLDVVRYRDGYGRVEDRAFHAFATVWVTDGGGRYQDAVIGNRDLARGDLILVFPGHRHSYGTVGDGRWSGIFTVFRGGLFAELERAGVMSRDRPVLHPGADPILADVHQRLEQLIRAGPPARAEAVASIHLLLARAHAADRDATADPGDQELARAAHALLTADLAQPLDPRDVARRLGVPWERLRKLLARELGEPPARLRIRRRIEDAKRLLLDGRTLAETAAALGYCDQYFFARQFRQVVGCAPGAWRIRVRG